MNKKYAYRYLLTSLFVLALGYAYQSFGFNLKMLPKDKIFTTNPANNFKNNVFAGYQAWFSTPNDGGANRWIHWSRSTSPRPGQITFELFPDLRDFRNEDLAQTDLGNLGNGESVRLYSAVRDGVIDTHFRWMSEYGIDGVALQRFLSETSTSTEFLNLRNNIAVKVSQAAERHRRFFYITIDISGSPVPTLVQDLATDVARMEELGIFKSPWYSRQGGKPVISVWGLGFAGRSDSPIQTQIILKTLKSKGFYVVAGTPIGWRTESGDARPGFLSTFLQFNMIQPWTTGHYSSDEQIELYYKNMAAPDRALCNQKHVDYQNVIFPGFAWSNWNGGTRNMIPRRGGQTFWTQANQVAKSNGSAYIAMFDEFDEGTAIAKAAENGSMAPINQYFLTLDADGIKMSSDFYLRLAGEAIKMIKGQRSFVETVPIPFR